MIVKLKRWRIVGADRAGKAGAHPGQVISAIIPARRIWGRVWVVLTRCAGGGRGGYSRGAGDHLIVAGWVRYRRRCDSE